MSFIFCAPLFIGVTIFDHDVETNDPQANDNDSSSDDDNNEAGIIIHAGINPFSHSYT